MEAKGLFSTTMAPTCAQEYKLNNCSLIKPNRIIQHTNKNVAKENRQKSSTEIFETKLHLWVGDVTQQ